MNTLEKLATCITILSSTNSCATINNGAEPKQKVQETRGEDCERLMLETKRRVGDVSDLLIYADYLKGRTDRREGSRELEDRIATVGGEFQRLEELETQMTQSCMNKKPVTDNDFMKMNQLQSAVQRLRLRYQRLKTGEPIQF